MVCSAVATIVEVDGVADGRREEVEEGTPVGEDAAALASRFDFLPEAIAVAVGSSGCFLVSVPRAVGGAGVWERSFVSAVVPTSSELEGCLLVLFCAVVFREREWYEG